MQRAVYGWNSDLDEDNVRRLRGFGVKDLVLNFAGSGTFNVDYWQFAGSGSGGNSGTGGASSTGGTQATCGTASAIGGAKSTGGTDSPTGGSNAVERDSKHGWQIGNGRSAKSERGCNVHHRRR